MINWKAFITCCKKTLAHVWRFVPRHSMLVTVTGSLLLCGAPCVTQTNATPRKLSLSECIQIALEHNLDVKVARFEPEIARQNLSAAYGAYEVGGTHSYSTSPGGIDAQNRPYPGTTTEGDAYRAGIVGLLPTGLRVDLGADLASRSGINPSGPFENADGSASIQLRQPILKNFWIDGPRLTIQVSKKQLQISELGLRGQIMAVVTAVQLSYYDLLLAQERIKVQEQVIWRRSRSGVVMSNLLTVRVLGAVNSMCGHRVFGATASSPIYSQSVARQNSRSRAFQKRTASVRACLSAQSQLLTAILCFAGPTQVLVAHQPSRL